MIFSFLYACVGVLDDESNTLLCLSYGPHSYLLLFILCKLTDCFEDEQAIWNILCFCVFCNASGHLGRRGYR